MAPTGEITEKQRERIYRRMAVGLLLSSPLLTALMSGSPYAAHSFLARGPSIFFLVACPLGGLLAVVIFEIALAKNRRFWIPRPEITVERIIPGELEPWLMGHLERLSEEGFSHTEPAPNWRWKISKNPHRFMASSFYENSFFGTVTVTVDGMNLKATLSLTLDDTIVVDSGENSKLQNYARYLLGEDEEELMETQVPLTLASSVFLGILAHAAGYFAVLSPIHFHLPVFEAAIFSMGEAIIMALVIPFKKNTLIGQSTALIMIPAGAAPLFSLICALIWR